MADWIADNVTEVVVEGRLSNGRPCINVLHVRREEDDPQESARDVLNNWQDHIVGGLLLDNYTLLGARYEDHNVQLGVNGFINPDGAKPVVGGNTQAGTTPNCALLVRKNIETAQGERKGRMYLDAVTEANVNEDGALTPAFIALAQPILDSFLAGLSGALDNELVVVHKKPLPTESPVDVVQSLTLDPLIATMRRRLRK